MKKSVFMFLATVATVAAVGLALAGCAGSPKAATATNIAPGSSIEGSWYQTVDSGEMGIVFENGIWFMSYKDFHTSKGTYEIQNGMITMIVTHVWEDIGSGLAWLSRADFRAFLLEEGFTPEEADAELDVILAPITASFKLTDRTLTLYGVEDGEAWEMIWQKR